MLELLYMSTKTIELGVSVLPNAVYIASWDAMLYHNTTITAGDFRKVFKDGTSFEMGQTNAFAGGYLSAEGGRGAVYVYQLIHPGGEIYDESNITLLDEISGLPLLGQNLNGINFYGKVSLYSFIDHVNSLVYTPDYHAIKVYDLRTGALVSTLNISGFTVLGYLTKIHYVNSASLLLHNWGSDRDRIVMIDRLTGEIIFQGTVNLNNKAVVYDSIHNVLIVVLDTGQVAVYALNNVSHAMSAPAFSPAPAQYTVSKVTTRLTGADDQGIAGKEVLWWLTNNKGELERPYTLTDAEGYACNWYYGPTGDYGLEEETLNVEVVV